MKILVLNAGSSSIKYQLFEMGTESALAKGLIDCIGEKKSHLKHCWMDKNNQQNEIEVNTPIATHKVGLELIVKQLRTAKVLKNLDSLDAIGHRVVHGGDIFQSPTLIDNNVIKSIELMVPLAPLHNPPNLEGIEVARKLLPKTPQVAVFDTAFHQTMPPEAYHYAIPDEWHNNYHVRRYGFHGTSHQYVAEQAASLLKRNLSELNLISLHLGNGCSATAIAKGNSVDTSMGMTPLEGLVMGTRCGDIDPALLFYIHREAKLELNEIYTLLNKESGLKGLCGVSDMREIEKRASTGDKAAQLAEATFVYRIRKYIGAYAAILGHVDALIFTGGIGENSDKIRERICHKLDILGMRLDNEKNSSASKNKEINSLHLEKSPIKILMIPTNEELAIARSTIKCL